MFFNRRYPRYYFPTLIFCKLGLVHFQLRPPTQVPALEADPAELVVERPQTALGAELAGQHQVAGAAVLVGVRAPWKVSRKLDFCCIIGPIHSVVIF